MKKLIKLFSAPDNKQLSAIANGLLYIAGPIGTFGIFILKFKGKITADQAAEFTTEWVSLIGAFKFLTKFSKHQDNDSNNNNNASQV